ncbi:MAG: ABC transporter substrate-binding protein, partial [Spirochaetia bacterium]|nr:ABC transporter substrate-binding protein [Spirochaetia bacterium]
SLKEIAGIDERFREFSAFRHARVYNAVLRVNANGGNDFYESGVVHPDLILGDLCKIFHPELFKDRAFFYYQSLP